MTNISALILAAQQAGYRVVHDDGLWWLVVPARPRHPQAVLGSWNDPQRAWRVAALVHSRLD